MAHRRQVSRRARRPSGECLKNELFSSCMIFVSWRIHLKTLLESNKPRLELTQRDLLWSTYFHQSSSYWCCCCYSIYRVSTYYRFLIKNMKLLIWEKKYMRSIEKKMVYKTCIYRRRKKKEKEKSETCDFQIRQPIWRGLCQLSHWHVEEATYIK